MLIYSCDICGRKWINKKGIVGNEFKYRDHFQTLTPSLQSSIIKDACTYCFEAIKTRHIREKSQVSDKVSYNVRGYIAELFQRWNK